MQESLRHGGNKKIHHCREFPAAQAPREPYPAAVSWRAQFAEEFEPEFFALQPEVQDAILTRTRLLRLFGPGLSRPHADRLNGSRHANMKEMRLNAAGGEWRIAFAVAFAFKRRAVLLVAGDKSGESSRRFYRKLIHKADKRFDRHLERLADGMERENRHGAGCG